MVKSPYSGRRQRGAVYTEFLIAMMPVLFFSMCIFQLCELYTGKVLTDHAAVAAGRAAAVIMADDPAHYTTPGAKEAAIRLAAIRAMGPFVHDGNITDVQVTVPQPKDISEKGPLPITVTAIFQCKVMLTYFVVCTGNGTQTLSSTYAFPNQGAHYTYMD
jgi:hypothetical protein